jgi:hypothetical protein
VKYGPPSSDPWRSAWITLTTGGTSAMEPVNSFELAAAADVLSDAGDEAAEEYAVKLRRYSAIEADAVTARLRLRQSRLAEAADAIERALIAYRADPWPLPSLMHRALETAVLVARADKQFGPRMYAALSRPFSTGQSNDLRLFYLVLVAYEHEQCGPRTADALRRQEPHVMWRDLILRIRSECSGKKEDYEEYKENDPSPREAGTGWPKAG